MRARIIGTILGISIVALVSGVIFAIGSASDASNYGADRTCTVNDYSC